MSTTSFQLTPREAIIETFSRFAKSLDDGDPDLLASVLTPDMVMDLTAFKAIGIIIPTLNGRENVVTALMKSVGKTQDSTHQLTNFLIQGKGDREASVQCYALAQHFKLDEGPVNGKEDYYLMGNRYDAVVVLLEGDWRIQRLAVRAQWVQGDVGVLEVH
jgi:hypothetical protein